MLTCVAAFGMNDDNEHSHLFVRCRCLVARATALCVYLCTMLTYLWLAPCRTSRKVQRACKEGSGDIDSGQCLQCLALWLQCGMHESKHVRTGWDFGYHS